METISKGYAGFAVIEYYASDEAVADCPFELAQSTKVSCADRRRRLDFDAGDGTGCLLEHDICFNAVPVSKMEEFCHDVVPTCLPSQFLKYKSFQKMPQEGSICRERLGVGAEQCCGDAGVGEMQFWTLDQPPHAIAVPGSESFEQEKPLKKCNEVSDRRSAEFEGRGQAAEIEELGGLYGGGTQQSWQDIE